MVRVGVVYLVGAGPGDPGLLTLRGAELLRQADVVIYDGLVSPDLLRLAPAGAELVYGGKHDRDHAVAQEELNDMMLRQARRGRRVVRLKGGDPTIFGRGGEEAEVLVQAGIPFELVPGVSSVQAVPGYAGIPVTHRGHNSCLVVVTGHDHPEAPGNKLDWPALARLNSTLVVLMGLRHLRPIALTLVQHGRHSDTPVAVIQQGTTPRQKTVVGTLENVADRVEASGLVPPALVVVGEVVRLRRELNWFENRPLFGRRIVVTQRADLAAPLVAALRDKGAHVLPIPVTQWGPPASTSDLDRALGRLPSYDWILFSHPLAVDSFFDRFLRQHSDWRALGSVRLGAYGPRTGAQLRQWHFLPAAVAADHKTPLIMRAISECGAIGGQRFLVVRGEEVSEPVPEALMAMGATVEVIRGFEVEPDSAASAESADLVENGAHWLVFASGLAVRHFHQRFNLPALLRQHPEMKLALTNHTFLWALEPLGLRPDLLSQPDDVEALMSDILRAEQRVATGRATDLVVHA